MCLSKTKPHGEPFNNKNNCNLDIGEVYDYSLNSPYGLSNLSNNSPKFQLQVQEILQDKYSPENIKNTYDRAIEREFKVEKRTREEKISIILAKLRMLIENSLEKNNKIGFEVLTKRYSMIKNMIK